MIPITKISKVTGSVFVFGDIHGCHSELQKLLDLVPYKENDLLIFLGDYIDRGPDSKKVIDILLKLKKEMPNTMFLKGNHEDMMLDWLGYNGTYGASWIMNGGETTLQNYGQTNYIYNNRIREDFKEELTYQNHLTFFLNLTDWILLNDKYLIVHAGIHPCKPLSEQTFEDLFWIRQEYIQHDFSTDSEHNFTIVSGHTPVKNIVFDESSKILLDTGCVYGNKLSCLSLDNMQVYSVEKD
jgi:serine/threonine protein phosphatase 1